MAWERSKTPRHNLGMPILQRRLESTPRRFLSRFGKRWRSWTRSYLDNRRRRLRWSQADASTEEVPSILNTIEHKLKPDICKLLINGAPGKTRTCDLLIRSQTLYPTELRARKDLAVLSERVLGPVMGLEADS